MYTEFTRFQEAGDGVETKDSREVEKRWVLVLFLIIVPYSKMYFFFLSQVFIETLLCSEPAIKHEFTVMSGHGLT